ncbi:Zinc/iron permease [Ascodesmis nigricans]|uniref:Zinc/iron permease n=1 Tax=Ascodesmis nigricans TaxID=341454 RepID=A0A4S2MR72_9PEZI|nr:Zinc/iron permease [Ascodesmis nigricans]
MIPNDQRGWILACASGVACVVGACLVNLDLFLHIVPRWRHFSIQRSTTFLAASLSLSFGVMFFSALSSLLPEGREYFLQNGYLPGEAAAASIGYFLVGVLGLQIVSELLHRCLPSSIVNCDEHGFEPKEPIATESQAEEGRAEHSNGHIHEHGHHPEVTERTPLVDSERPSLRHAVTDVFVKRRPCEAGVGKCYGYGDHACQQRCGGAVCVGMCTDGPGASTPLIEEEDVDDFLETQEVHHQPANGHAKPHSVRSRPQSIKHGPHHHHHVHDHTHGHEHPEGHHHVARNRFLSIGLQTAIAVALHKFPEGFITYATNHANPDLGFTVFVALFVHNIAEGFAMVLPLYLAFASRTKAVLWASLLGGFAQPIGAGIAWACFTNRDFKLNGGAYGVLFCITSGIMCSVGLQLFSQAIQIHHGSRLAFVFAFIGMGILGFSNALTQE